MRYSYLISATALVLAGSAMAQDAVSEEAAPSISSAASSVESAIESAMTVSFIHCHVSETLSLILSNLFWLRFGFSYFCRTSLVKPVAWCQKPPDLSLQALQ